MSPRPLFHKLAVTALTLGPLAAQAQGTSAEVAPSPTPLFAPGTLPRGIAETLIYGFVGIFLALSGYKLFNLVTSWDLCKEIAEDQNTSAAIVVGAMILGVSIIVGLTIATP